jgi:diguanylate cyclase (GGDEF)-like protein
MRPSALRKTVNRIAITIAVAVASAIPTVHIIDKYHEQVDKLELKAAFIASRVAQYIYLNEELWRYQTVRLNALIELPERVRDVNFLRIIDPSGIVMVGNGPKIDRPVRTFTVPIFVKGTEVGRVEIDYSLRPLLVEAALAITLGILLGLATYLTIRLLPMRALDRTLNALERQNRLFDEALNSMSQGLCRFDAGQKLVVTNRRYRELFGLSGEQVKPGATLRQVLEHRQANGTLGASTVADRLHNHRAIPEETMLLEDGRTIRLLRHPMPDGGWVATFEDVTERHASEIKMAYMAGHDALTGLVNRAVFMERIGEAGARLHRLDERFSVFLLDLDRFKDVNDTLGHPAGDLLLQQTTQRLRSVVRETDVLARFGGDEFAILLTSGVDQREAAMALANRVIGTLSAPFEIDGTKVNVGASVGIAAAPDDGTDAVELLKKADMALYQAKSGGRNRWCFFDGQMLVATDQRLRLENDLRRAIAGNELELHYQPIIDARTGMPCAAEALLRWNHPELGMLMPETFIPLAEQTGLIAPIGEWVLQQACADAAGWPAHIKVAINLSPRQFDSAGLLDVVVCALVESGLSPHRLEVEITETVVLANNPEHRAILRQLKGLGISIALDDFGTGYSSLSTLTMFPFDKIKIDKSFTRHMTKRPSHAAIIASALAISRGLDMTTTAEGVETKEQLESLRASGVTFVQGFLFAKPCPASELEFTRTSGKALVGSAA